MQEARKQEGKEHLVSERVSESGRERGRDIGSHAGPSS